MEKTETMYRGEYTKTQLPEIITHCVNPDCGQSPLKLVSTQECIDREPRENAEEGLVVTRQLTTFHYQCPICKGSYTKNTAWFDEDYGKDKKKDSDEIEED
ncbi:MAG: hypothetical protein ACE5OZ_11425 [Candidatus Heimdallarchaeota archaeon]